MLCIALGGVWFDHVLSWWKHRDDPKTLFLKYEDRIKVIKAIEIVTFLPFFRNCERFD